MVMVGYSEVEYKILLHVETRLILSLSLSVKYLFTNSIHSVSVSQTSSSICIVYTRNPEINKYLPFKLR